MRPQTRENNVEIARLPPDEADRLKELGNYDVLDTPAERRFDNITKMAAKICGCPIALVSLVDDSRQWFKSKVGLDACETSRDYAFCAHAILEEGIFQVPDSRLDERFRDNPLVIGEPRVIFYAGVPIFSRNGHKLGTLCVIDHEPKRLSSDQAEVIVLLSEQVAELLELRRHEVELGLQKDRLKGIVHNMPLGLCRWEMDESNRLLLCEANAAADKILGQEHEAKLGENIDMVLSKLKVPKLYDQAMDVAKHSALSSSEVAITEEDGGTQTLAIYQFKSDKQSVVTLVQDVSELRHKEKVLKETLRKLNLMTKGSSDGFWHMPDLKNSLPECSDRLYELLEYSKDEFLPTLENIQSRIHQQDIENALFSVYRAIEHCEPFDFECRIAHKSGEFHWYRARGAVYANEKGSCYELAGSISPIGATKALESQLRRSNQELERFAYRTSHDLKAPLLSSKRLTEFIIEDIDNGDFAEAKQNVQKIGSQMERSTRLVADILSLVKADLRKEPRQKFTLQEVLEEIELDLTQMLEISACKIIKKGDFQRQIKCERVRMTQILENLISNGIKYCDPAKVECFVKVAVEFLDDHFVIMVSDNGVGIPEEHHSQVFEAFTRFHQSVSFGSGLGLSIVKQHVDKLGGSISLKSSTDGSQFTLTLPAYN